MIQFLTDEHISPRVAAEAVRKCPGIRIESLQRWHGGAFLGVSDEVLIPAGGKEGCVLVTYDLRTIPFLLKGWAESGVDYGGIVFVDQRSIPPQRVGALVRALCELWRSEHAADWRNRVVFLKAVGE